MIRWHHLADSAVKWLYPGLKIKRWLLLALGGLGASLLGFTLLVGPDLYLSGKAVASFLTSLRGTVYGAVLLALGLTMIAFGLQRATRAAGEALHFNPGGPLIDSLFIKRCLESGPRVVTIGGGTGLSVLLRELKNYTGNLTAVVTVTDDGGSSGRLRGELGMPPPGDIRSCLLALADTEPLMEKLFEHRFAGGAGLEGHSFGNLFIAAMTEMFGFQEAVKLFGQVLAIRGRVFPVTGEMVQLESEAVDGTRIRGEAVLSGGEVPLKRVSLLPPEIKPLPEVPAAIHEADAVVLGPGSLFTSIIPNLLVPGIVEALLNTPAIVFYICNVMTEPGQTNGFTAADHVQAVLEHSDRRLLDYIVVNSDLALPAEKLEPFRRRGSELVRPDYQRLRGLAGNLIGSPLISHDRVTRHNGPRLARVIVEQITAHRQRSRGKTLEGRLFHFNSRLRRMDLSGGRSTGSRYRCR